VEVLNNWGFVVAEAENGAAGLTKVLTDPPDLIITDIAMPVMDGYEFVQQVRQQYDPDLPIIASSASVSASDQAVAIARGCNEFLPKPVDLESLLSMVQKLCQLNWVYAEAPSQVDAQARNSSEIILPPYSELITLEQAANIGDIEIVEMEAERIKKISSDYVNFAQMVLEMAGSFDADQIGELVKKVYPNMENMNESHELGG
jgi:CheY-like chemotaxis protein